MGELSSAMPSFHPPARFEGEPVTAIEFGLIHTGSDYEKRSTDLADV
jgi:hypothetical protein